MPRDYFVSLLSLAPRRPGAAGRVLKAFPEPSGRGGQPGRPYRRPGAKRSSQTPELRGRDCTAHYRTANAGKRGGRFFDGRPSATRVDTLPQRTPSWTRWTARTQAGPGKLFENPPPPDREPHRDRTTPQMDRYVALRAARIRERASTATATRSNRTTSGESVPDLMKAICAGFAHGIPHTRLRTSSGRRAKERPGASSARRGGKAALAEQRARHENYAFRLLQ
jgi:hypothetical protein